MRHSRVIHNSDEFVREFSRCCTEYGSVHLAVAWCGDPKQTLPYRHLEDFEGDITATVGTSFKHTHPDAIEWFARVKADIRLVRDSGELFHPKVYLFTNEEGYALFVGSSNLTYGGSYANLEVNALIEGKWSKRQGRDVRRLQKQLAIWRSPKYSFRPESDWPSLSHKPGLILQKATCS